MYVSILRYPYITGIPSSEGTVLEGWSGSSDERELWRKCPNNIHLHYNVIVYTWLKWPQEVCCYPSLTFLYNVFDTVSFDELVLGY